VAVTSGDLDQGREGEGYLLWLWKVLRLTQAEGAVDVLSPGVVSPIECFKESKAGDRRIGTAKVHVPFWDFFFMSAHRRSHEEVY